MKKLAIYYNFIIVTIMTLTGFLLAQTFAEITGAILFFPLAVYFMMQVFPKNRKALIVPEILSPTMPHPKGKKALSKKRPQSNADSPSEDSVEEGVLVEKKGLDIDRRMFLKLIGSAGLTIFFFSIFTKKAEGAFFGSVPGPGTVALKDSTGALIDPAIKTPTDGYKITQLDDSTPAYYGFVEKTGKWFIMKEESNGDYRYTKGDSGFSTGWTNRASLTYDYFDVIF